jgi:pilus assembly protein Flp/PilA
VPDDCELQLNVLAEEAWSSCSALLSTATSVSVKRSFQTNENGVTTMLKLFLADDDGAQVVEYALAIAVISILLSIALQPLTTGAGLSDLVDLVRTCLGGVDCG